MHGLAYCFLFFIQAELISVLLEPSIELDQQVTLVHFVFQVELYLCIVFTGQGIVFAKVLIEFLEYDIELFLEEFCSLCLGGLWMSKFGWKVEGVFEVLEYVGLFHILKKCIHEIIIILKEANIYLSIKMVAQVHFCQSYSIAFTSSPF